MAWEQVAKGYRCTEHGETFRAGKHCSGCMPEKPGNLSGSDDLVIDKVMSIESISRRVNTVYLLAVGSRRRKDMTADPKRLAVALSALRLAYDIAVDARDPALLKKYQDLELRASSRRRGGQAPD